MPDFQVMKYRHSLATWSEMLGTCLQEAMSLNYILHLCFSGRYTNFLGSVYALVSAEISKLHCSPNYPAVTTRLIPVSTLVQSRPTAFPERIPRHKLPNLTFKNPEDTSFIYFTLKSRNSTQQSYQTITFAFHGDI